MTLVCKGQPLNCLFGLWFYIDIHHLYCNLHEYRPRIRGCPETPLITGRRAPPLKLPFFPKNWYTCGANGRVGGNVILVLMATKVCPIPKAGWQLIRSGLELDISFDERVSTTPTLDPVAVRSSHKLIKWLIATLPLALKNHGRDIMGNRSQNTFIKDNGRAGREGTTIFLVLSDPRELHLIFFFYDGTLYNTRGIWRPPISRQSPFDMRGVRKYSWRVASSWAILQFRSHDWEIFHG